MNHLLRKLDHNYLLSPEEQKEIAELIRLMQKKMETALIHLQRGSELDVVMAIRILK